MSIIFLNYLYQANASYQIKCARGAIIPWSMALSQTIFIALLLSISTSSRHIPIFHATLIIQHEDQAKAQVFRESPSPCIWVIPCDASIHNDTCIPCNQSIHISFDPIIRQPLSSNLPLSQYKDLPLYVLQGFQDQVGHRLNGYNQTTNQSSC